MISPKISIVVVNWNNYEDTSECLASLSSISYANYQIILVDNGSTDGSSEALENSYPDVIIIRNERNLGFAGGANVGIRYVLEQGTDYIFVLNNDAVVDSRVLDFLLKEATKDRRIGILGPRILYYHDPLRIWHGGGFFNYIKGGPVVPEKGKIKDNCGKANRDVDFITGCAMLIRPEVFDRIGLLSEDYFFYVEDVDFCLRAKRAGFRLLYVPQGEVWHKVTTLRKWASPFSMYHQSKGRLLLFRRNFSTPYFIWGLLTHVFAYTPIKILQSFLYSSHPLASAVSWIRGIFDGFSSQHKVDSP